MISKKIGFAIISVGICMIFSSGSIIVNNVYTDIKAGEESRDIISKLTDYQQMVTSQDEALPDYFDGADNELVSVKVYQNDYIGTLSIPNYGLELPVMKDWSYSGLQISPCRYYGTVYKNNMIIAAHNYYSHFGSIGGLSKGDVVSFRNIDGLLFKYVVAEKEVLQPDEVDKMCNDNWDLTLFTCSLGGESRITVRCKLEG